MRDSKSGKRNRLGMLASSVMFFFIDVVICESFFSVQVIYQRYLDQPGCFFLVLSFCAGNLVFFAPMCVYLVYDFS